MKVWEYNGVGVFHRVVAASKRDAMEAFGLSAEDFEMFASETHLQADKDAAMQAPGRVFRRPCFNHKAPFKVEEPS